MLKTIHYKREYHRWQQRYDAAAQKVGDEAPDFVLSDASGENPMRLSDFKGKRPVALIFGSFT